MTTDTSETNASTEASTSDTTTEATTDTTQTNPAETVEFWKSKAREQEKRAKANADAAKRLAEIEEAQKTEAEKAADRIKQAEADTEKARAEALRLRIAAKHGISDEHADLYLTGTDEETLTKQAEGLSKLASDRKKNGNVVPREGSTSTAAPDDERAAARALFGSGT